MGASGFPEVLAGIDDVKGRYYRLLLLVGFLSPVKNEALQGLSAATGAPIINVNLELSRRMLELTQRQRALQAQDLMQEILAEVRDEVVILDRIEILHSQELELDPLRLLRDLSRNRTIAAVWNGTVTDNHLIYAEPGHPEFRRYPTQDLQIICIDDSK